MTTLTLLTKIYNSHQLREIDRNLADLLGDLSVEAKVTGTAAGKWVQLDISGEDESVASKLLERETGFCPVYLENVKKFAALKGYVVNLERSKEELLLDIGVFDPKPVYASVALSHLQHHFSGGRQVILKVLVESWGFCENLPLELKVLDVDLVGNRVKAELQTSQINRFHQWKDSMLDRLLVIGASLGEVKLAIEQEGLDRDVIDVESFGIFEHALVCKLGTDAAGLIGRIGRHLRKAKFTVFNPKALLLAQK
jgi:hypothetical protein